MVTSDAVEKESKSSADGHKAKKSESVVSYSDEEFKVKAKTHEELEIEIQSARILYVLDEMSKKLQIAANLPFLIEDEGNLLRGFLPRSQVDYILRSCRKYIDSERDESTDGRSEYSTLDPPLLARFDTVIQPKESKILNTRISEIIEILFTNEELMRSLNWLDCDIDPVYATLIESAKSLREAAAKKLAVSALQERNRERQLRIAWKDNLEAKTLIKQIQEKLDRQKQDLSIHIHAKEQMIKAYEAKIGSIQEKFKENINKRVTDSEKAMIKHTQESEERQAILAQTAKDATQAYNVLLEQHLQTEKVLRAKRYKIEAQLGSWLAKYDADVGDRQTEFENLTKVYEDEMEEMSALQAKFDEQEEEYIELTAERDEYERRIFEEKAYIFISNRAAKRIQRCWREYRERKRLRKKARRARAKAKKEKKAAPVAVEDELGGEEEIIEQVVEEKKPKGKKEKGAKGKGKGKAPKVKGEKGVLSGVDPNEAMEAKFQSHVFEDMSAEPMPGDVEVNL